MKKSLMFLTILLSIFLWGFDNSEAANYHTVKKGETLSGIAKKYQCDVKKIEKVYGKKGRLEKISNPNFLKIGWVLKIPEKNPPAIPEKKLFNKKSTVYLVSNPKTEKINPILEISLINSSSKKLSKEEIKDLIIKIFGKEKGKIAISIAYAESSFVSNVIGDKELRKGPSIGLFQINLFHHPNYKDPIETEKLKNPYYNIRAAKKIFDEREKMVGDGFLAWSSYKKKRHLKFL